MLEPVTGTARGVAREPQPVVIGVADPRADLVARVTSSLATGLAHDLRRVLEHLALVLPEVFGLCLETVQFPLMLP